MDSVYNYNGREIFAGEREDVVIFLLKRNIPRDYKVSSRRLGDKQITVHKYLTFESVSKKPNKSPYKSFEGKTMPKSDFEEFVPKYYVMDPKIEEVIPYTSHLENGMCVLIESAEDKVEITMDMSVSDRYQAMIYNRWCRVTQLKIHGDKGVTFVGVYDDETQRTREYSSRNSWIVKKNTIPGSPTFDSNALAGVFQVAAETRSQTAPSPDPFNGIEMGTDEHGSMKPCADEKPAGKISEYRPAIPQGFTITGRGMGHPKYTPHSVWSDEQ